MDKKSLKQVLSQHFTIQDKEDGTFEIITEEGSFLVSENKTPNSRFDKLPNFILEQERSKGTNSDISPDFDNKIKHPDIQKAGFTKESLRKKLLADNYIYALFDSPTNTGLKALVKIPTIAHRQSFQALEKYFKDNYNNLQIDTNCNNQVLQPGDILECTVNWKNVSNKNL